MGRTRSTTARDNRERAATARDYYQVAEERLLLAPDGSSSEAQVAAANAISAALAVDAVARDPRDDEGQARCCCTGLASRVERMTGIEPALSAWEAEVLPLNYIRVTAPPAGNARPA